MPSRSARLAVDDPWATSRMPRAEDMQAAENVLHPAVRKAVEAYVKEVRAGMYGGGQFADRRPDLSGFPPDSRWGALVQRFIEPAATRVFTRSYGTLAQASGDSFQVQVRRYGSGIAGRLMGFPRHVFEQLRRAVGGGAVEEVEPSTLTRRVDAVLSPGQQAGQVLTMTRTEAHTSFNAGQMAAALDESERTGEPWSKRWISTRDEHVRLTHATADGQQRALDQPFLVGVAQLQFPGDPAAPPGEVINCRCNCLYLPDSLTASLEASMHRAVIGEARPQAVMTMTAAAGADSSATQVHVSANGRWQGVLGVMDEWSADRRMLAAPEGAIRTRPLPLPLLLQPELAPGHDKGQLGIAQIDRVWAEGNRIMGSGSIDMSDPAGKELARKIGAGFIRFVSLDVDDSTELQVCLDAEDNIISDCDPATTDSAAGFGQVYSGWRVMGATLLAHPAFPDAHIALAEEGEAIRPTEPGEDHGNGCVCPDSEGRWVECECGDEGSQPANADKTGPIQTQDQGKEAMATEEVSDVPPTPPGQQEAPYGCVAEDPETPGGWVKVDCAADGAVPANETGDGPMEQVTDATDDAMREEETNSPEGDAPAEGEAPAKSESELEAEDEWRDLVANGSDLEWAPRDYSWDPVAAVDRLVEYARDDDGTLDPEDMARGFLYLRPGADTNEVGSWALPVADVVEGDMRVVLGGVTGAADALTGKEGVEQLDAGDLLPDVQARINALYEQAAQVYDDPSIQSPFNDVDAGTPSQPPTPSDAPPPEGAPADSATPAPSMEMAVNTDLPWADRDREWDGDAAHQRVAQWATSGTGENASIDPDKMTQAFLVVDGPPENVGSYKFGVADIIDGRLRLVWNGVVAANAALQGARGGTNIPADQKTAAENRIKVLYGKAAAAFDDPTISDKAKEMGNDSFQEEGEEPPADGAAPAEEAPQESASDGSQPSYITGTASDRGYGCVTQEEESGRWVKVRCTEEGARTAGPNGQPVNKAGEFDCVVPDPDGDGRWVTGPCDAAGARIAGPDGQPLPPAEEDKAREALVAAAGCLPCDTVTTGKPVEVTEEALVASVAAPGFTPPGEWFKTPNFSGPTPITVDPETGRIYGHLAEWNTCHVGFSDRCILPPRSRTNYAFFHSATVPTDTGQMDVGVLTMDTGHAALNLNASNATAHYDNTGTQCAVVRAGEDAYGVWLVGACLPFINADQRLRLSLARFSGDWRAIRGGAELVAALAVNSPGFPVPQRRRGADNHDYALVAAGLLPAARPEPKKKRSSRRERAREETIALTRPEMSSIISEAVREAFAQQEATQRKERLAALERQAQAVTEEQSARSRYAGARGSVARLRVQAAKSKLAAQSRKAGGTGKGQLAGRKKSSGVATSDLPPVSGLPEPSKSDLELAEQVLARKNWVAQQGGLPPYIKRIAKHLKAKGMGESQAIAVAVNVVKKMCKSGDTNWPGVQNVNAKSRAQACAAVTRWEAMKKAAKAS